MKAISWLRVSDVFCCAWLDETIVSCARTEFVWAANMYRNTYMSRLNIACMQIKSYVLHSTYFVVLHVILVDCALIMCRELLNYWMWFFFVISILNENLGICICGSNETTTMYVCSMHTLLYSSISRIIHSTRVSKLLVHLNKLELMSNK